MKRHKEVLIVFALGGLIYGMIEVLSRGFTHWTMILTGGAAFLTLYMINIIMIERNFIVKCFVGSLAITTIEFAVGFIVNHRFGMGVWDYSNQKLNILGQVCPLFSIYWFLLCIPGLMICYYIQRSLNNNKNALIN